MATITSANAEYSLAVSGLFPIPQTLHGYAADDAFTTQAIQSTEIVMGMDGHMSVGFVNNPVIQEITLMPDSPSNFVFQQWWSQQYAAKEALVANGSIALASVGQTYTMTRGALTSYMPIYDAKKVLQAAKYQITWESVVGAPI